MQVVHNVGTLMANACLIQARKISGEAKTLIVRNDLRLAKVPIEYAQMQLFAVQTAKTNAIIDTDNGSYVFTSTIVDGRGRLFVLVRGGGRRPLAFIRLRLDSIEKKKT